MLDVRDDLRTALRGVRGLLLDLDGVIVLAGKPIRGAPEALRELDRRGLPFRIVTNTSLVSRATLSAWSASLGAPIPPSRFHSALSISAAYTAARFAGQPLYVLASRDALTEFDGQRLLSDEEASAPEARAAAVVVGDSPESATWDHLNRAFRLVRNGAALIGMHKNRWWLTPDGPTLDSGAFETGLEFAADVRATILGKPSRAFFTLAARDLAAEVAEVSGRGRGGGRIRRADLAMVGDDVWSDALAARRAGLRGIVVLSGKHGSDDLARAAAQARGGGRPDAVAASLAEVVAALD
ncbi:MAG TPA: HAD-IIA family hydrolase [Candidatus Limnocylindrales bacterium]|nr:HAD-IIA family hydrolase [Candidatus Limnocylindrales bacterium]